MPPNQEGQQQSNQGNQNQPPLTWDVWHGALDDSAKKLIDEHTTGLRTALDGERNGKKSWKSNSKLCRVGLKRAVSLKNNLPIR